MKNLIQKTTYIGVFIFCSSVLFIQGCSKTEPTTQPGMAIVSTTTAIGQTATQITLGGNITADGGNAVSKRGIVIGSTANPVITDTSNFISNNGTGIGAYTETVDITAAPNGTYHYRAYATNSSGTSYGEDKTFIKGSASCNVITITDNITTPTTFTANNVYIIDGDVSVRSVLTIDPGTIIKMKNGSITVLTSSGKIIANGTASQRIVFTSYADDSYCGDNNGDGAATKPEKGDWYYLQFADGTNHSLKFCDILYGGKSAASSNNCIRINSGGNSITIDNCTIAHVKNGSSSSSSSTAAVSGGDAMNDASTTVFTNNAIYDCDIPIHLSHGYTLNPNNIFHNPANPSETNRRNAIFMAGTGFSLSSVTWAVTEVPYIVQDYLQFTNTKTVVVGENVKVKFTGSSYGISFNPSLFTYPASVIFTSFKDDAVGGDSNGDGATTSPAASDWLGMFNWSSSGAKVTSANIRYAKP